MSYKNAQIETLQPDFSTRSQWHKLTWQVWNGVEKLLTLGFASPRESHHHRFGDPSKLNSFKKSVSYHQFWLVFFFRVGKRPGWCRFLTLGCLQAKFRAASTFSMWKHQSYYYVCVHAWFWSCCGPFVFNPSFSGTTRKGLNDDGYDDFVWLFPFDIWWQ